MNNLLVFFALPVATIILAIVLQKVINNPTLVGITFFAIYLIVTYAAFDSDFLIFAVIYAILAYISAVISCLISNLINQLYNDGKKETIRSEVMQESTEGNQTNFNRRICNNCYRYTTRF